MCLYNCKQMYRRLQSLLLLLLRLLLLLLQPLRSLCRHLCDNQFRTLHFLLMYRHFYFGYMSATKLPQTLHTINVDFHLSTLLYFHPAFCHVLYSLCCLFFFVVTLLPFFLSFLFQPHNFSLCVCVCVTNHERAFFLCRQRKG